MVLIELPSSCFFVLRAHVTDLVRSVFLIILTLLGRAFYYLYRRSGGGVPFCRWSISLNKDMLKTEDWIQW